MKNGVYRIVDKKIMSYYHFNEAKVWFYVGFFVQDLTVLNMISFVGAHNVQQGEWYCIIYSILHILQYHTV